MLKIILCDDDRFMLDLSAQTVQKAIERGKLEAEVVCAAQDYQDLARFLVKNPGIYLYFLDYALGKNRLNGVDAGKKIKEKEPLSKIVFVTSHGDLGMSILQSGVEPFGFVEKSLDIEKMARDYQKYMQLAAEQPHFAADAPEERGITLSIDGDDALFLPLSQISYVETHKSVSHFICYHTLDGSQIAVRDTMDHAQKILGGQFIQSHRSVLVNQKHIIGVEDGLVRLSNGETAACSFRRRKEIAKHCLTGSSVC